MMDHGPSSLYSLVSFSPHFMFVCLLTPTLQSGDTQKRHSSNVVPHMAFPMSRSRPRLKTKTTRQVVMLHVRWFGQRATMAPGAQSMTRACFRWGSGWGGPFEDVVVMVELAATSSFMCHSNMLLYMYKVFLITVRVPGWVRAEFLTTIVKSWAISTMAGPQPLERSRAFTNGPKVCKLP